MKVNKTLVSVLTSVVIGLIGFSAQADCTTCQHQTIAKMTGNLRMVDPPGITNPPNSTGLQCLSGSCTCAIQSGAPTCTTPLSATTHCNPDGDFIVVSQTVYIWIDGDWAIDPNGPSTAVVTDCFNAMYCD